MAQKSLPVLNKVNTSMVWYTTYYYKHYKWLSSQNLYLLYFFNKLFVYLDFLFFNLFWVDFYSTQLYSNRLRARRSKFTKQRFFRPITSYLIALNNSSAFINIYYKTSLEKFQNLNAQQTSVTHNFNTELKEFNIMNRLCLFK